MFRAGDRVSTPKGEGEVLIEDAPSGSGQILVRFKESKGQGWGIDGNSPVISEGALRELGCVTKDRFWWWWPREIERMDPPLLRDRISDDLLRRLADV